jgi:hypothetical protein
MIVHLRFNHSLDRLWYIREEVEFDQSFVVEELGLADFALLA